MTKLLTAAQMGTIERAAIESGQVTGLELMERAGRGAVAAVFETWPMLGSRRHHAVILCGPGNNGGDGFVVARLLAELDWQVDLFLFGDPEKLPPDAKANADRWAETRAINRLTGDLAPAQKAPALVVDALFGTGLTRPINGFAPLFRDLAQTNGPRRVAIDMPSGLCSDSGKVLTDTTGAGPFSACADLTVTFHTEKSGHHLGRGPEHCGAVKVVDIGLNTGSEASRAALARLGGYEATGPELIEGPGRPDRAVDILTKKVGAHKYAHGHALVLSGGAGRTGAARLAARAALRIGAGLVTLGVPPSAQQEVACQITALMLQRVDGGEALEKVLEDARLNALCLGPGLGMERARDLVPVALAAGGLKTHPTRRVVLDADALTAFAQAPDTLFDLLHEGCVLTPHGGEFARLFPDLAERLEAQASFGPAYSKVDATRAAARRAGCTVVFKGPDTVIADAGGACAIHSAQYDRAAPWLATAGTGDVLAGFITGLLARGGGPMQAAQVACWLHCVCARSFGPGLIAEDLPETLPRVLRDLGPR